MSTTKKGAVAKKKPSSKSKSSVKKNIEDLKDSTLKLLMPLYQHGKTVYLVDRVKKKILKCTVESVNTVHLKNSLPEAAESIFVNHYYTLEWNFGRSFSEIPEEDIIPTFKEASYQLGLVCVE